MNWPLFFSNFSFIFFAALPGRTTFIMLLMAAKRPPMPIFIGSSLAFIIQSAIAVTLGSILRLFPQSKVDLVAGLLFLFFAILAWREKEVESTPLAAEKTLFGDARKTFVVVFAAEWGDVSQLAIASTAAHYQGYLRVWFSSVTALILIALAAIILGSHSRKFIPQKLIHHISSLAFAGVGIYFISRALQTWN